MKASLLAALALVATPALLATPALADEVQMAITVDDLPAHSALPPGVTRVQIAEGFLAALKDAKAAPVYGFINGVQTQREPDSAPVLELWRKAGHPLGNHTWSHQALARLDLPTFEAEVARNEPILQKLAGDTDWRWLRFPFLNEGDTPAKRDGAWALLKARGYRIASVTMTFGDYEIGRASCRERVS
jgi:peptidoglycan/xylan/chitin deacetylase (PgdA/CDA1 family)